MIQSRAWFVLLLGALANCGDTSTDAVIPAPEKVTITGMSNTVRVGDLLFGGQPSKTALIELRARGYKTILSTRGLDEIPWDEKALADSLGMRFVCIPMEKPVTAIDDDQVERFAELMGSGERPMILHCGSGNRVAGLWAVWLVEREGWARDPALRLGEQVGMTRIRPVVLERLGRTDVD